MESFRTVSLVGSRPQRPVTRSHSMLPLPFDRTPDRPPATPKAATATVAATLAPRRQRGKLLGEITPSPARLQAQNASDSKLPMRPSTLPRSWAGTGGAKKTYPALGDTFNRPTRLTSTCRQPSRVKSFTPLNSATPRKGPGQTASSIPDFAPSNHHPDLLAAITPGASAVPQSPNTTSTQNATAHGSTSAIRINNPQNLLTPPDSPQLPAVESNLSDLSSLEDFSLHEGSPPHSPRLNALDRATGSGSAKELIAHQQYNAQEGLLWDTARWALEQDFLHPVNLTESEFVSLVCGSARDRAEWFRDNLPSVIKRTIDQWMRAHHTLVKAGIPPSDLKKETLDAFEFMDDSQQSYFIQSYKLAERQLLTAGDDMSMTRQQRDYFGSLPLPEKYNFIKNHTAPSFWVQGYTQSQELSSRQSRVDLLKSKKAEKLKALKEKLDEMKQIEQDIRELEERSSESSDQQRRDLTSSEVYDDDHLEMDFGAQALTEQDDPFVDQPYEASSKGNIFHEYTLSERTNQQKQSTTPEVSISDQKPSVAYHDSGEYRDFMDDSWHCFEDSDKAKAKADANVTVEVTALPESAPETMEIETASISSADSMAPLVSLDIPEPYGEIKETSVPNEYKVVRKVSDNMDIESFATVGEQARIFAKELSEIAKILESGVHNFGAIEDKLQQANYKASLDSAICLPEPPISHMNTRDSVPISHTLERKTSMTTILSESSTTSDAVVLKDVAISTPDVGYESSRSSRVEYMGPLFARERERVSGSGEEDGAFMKRRSGTIRKRMSQFFGSIRRINSKMPSPAIRCMKEDCGNWAESSSRFCSRHN